MNFIQDLSDLKWIKEIDPDFHIALDTKETHTTVWVTFLCTLKELNDKLDSIGYGFGCCDVNMAKEGYQWFALDNLEAEEILALMDVPYEYRYILDTVSRS